MNDVLCKRERERERERERFSIGAAAETFRFREESIRFRTIFRFLLDWIETSVEIDVRRKDLVEDDRGS